jgi:CheY-like chemotaxis protein
MHVIVCDDDPVARLVVTRMVAKATAGTVSQSADGAEALRIILRGGVDLLILDVNMPAVGGFQVLETIRRSTQYGNLPVILVSSEARQEIVSPLLKLGVLGYVLKPVQPNRLAVLLEQVKAATA